MTEHTQEPWGYIRTVKKRHVLVSDSGHVADFDNPADAHRAYACVNALEGIDDPAAFMREIRMWRELKRGDHQHTAIHNTERVIFDHLKGGTA